MAYFGFKSMLAKLAWALLALAAIMTVISAIITAVYIERCGDDVETLAKTNPNDRAPRLLLPVTPCSDVSNSREGGQNPTPRVQLASTRSARTASR